jgi:TonB family protein
MASPAELGQLLPDTLPEDFSEWDGEGSSAAVPAGHGGSEGSSGADDGERPFGHGVERQAPVRAETDPSRHQPSLPPESTHRDYEALRDGLRTIGAALRQEPVSPAPAAADTCTPKEDLCKPVQTNNAAVNGSFNPPLLPPAAGADEEAFFSQLRAMGSVLNTQPIRPAHKPVLARVLHKPGPDRGFLKLEPPAAPTPKAEPVRKIEDPSPKPAFSAPPAPVAPAPVAPAPVAPAPVASAPAVPEPVAVLETAPRRWPIKPIEVTATISAADAIAIPSFRSDLDDEGDENAGRKKWMKIGAVGLPSLLLLIFLGVRLTNPGKPTLAKQSVDTPAAAADVNPEANTQKPSPSTRLSASGQPDAGRLAGTRTENPAPQVDSQSMTDQLMAAPLIPQDVKVKKIKEEAPPEGMGAAKADEVAGSNPMGDVFIDQAHPTVKYVPYPVVTIPAATADGLLIERTQPVYPRDAWYGYISGKVELEATVSRTGYVESVRLVKGQRIFEQAASDAVRSWRYRPYVIDNVPREFQTTIELTFDRSSGPNPLSLLHLGSHSKKELAAQKNPDTDTP